ncbi:MAG: OmpH family outer membrane protein [Nitrospirota bacterium]|nr:MAG: OmpH family outer membrane protein [Nitrospirota bacterium]
MKRLFVIMMIMSLALTISVYAEDLKIGYVDMRAALNESEQGKKAKAELEKMIQEKQKGLDAERKKLDETQADLEKKMSLLSDKAKEEKQKEFQEMVQGYQKKLADAQKEINEKEASFTKKILDDIKGIVDDIAKKEGYSLIFEKTEISVIFSKDGLDITKRVIETYNSKSK